MKLIKIGGSVLALSMLVLPFVGFAQGNPNFSGLTDNVSLGYIPEFDAATETLAERVVNWMITLFWIATVGFLIWAAYLYLTAGGDEEAVGKAKKYLMYALVGGLVALLSTSLTGVIRNLLGGGGT